MNVHVVKTSLESAGGDWLVVGVPEAAELPRNVQELDRVLGGRITRIREGGDFTGKPAELLALREADPLAAKRLLLVGLGKPAELTPSRFEKACLTAIRHITEKKNNSVAFSVPEVH